ncbi:hypothetical protein TYRP_003510 [Tyrophagus putrescentiae]|nr:hypothetical protein TYRP_003510 [Tyrophagus putrescentiae]
MPGYELSRFTSASSKEVKELLCTICGDVYCHPLQTKCCSKLFCESCIRQWIISNRSCPFDSRPLTAVEELVAAPESLITLLGRQRLKCAFVGKGCPEVVSLADVVDHERYCIFDRQPCTACGFMATSDHDCVRSLVEYRTMGVAMLAMMRRERAEVRHFNAEAVRTLTVLGPPSRTSPGSWQRMLSVAQHDEQQQQQQSPPTAENGSPPPSPLIRIATNEELMAEARRQLQLGTAITLDGRRTKKEVVERVFAAIRELFLGTEGEGGSGGCTTVQEVVRSLKTFMDGQYLGNWYCSLLVSGQGLFAHNIQSDGYVEVRLGRQLCLTLYKTSDPHGFSRVMQGVKAGTIRDFAAIRSGFDRSACREIERMVMAVLKGAAADNADFSGRAAAALTANYGGSWSCLLFKGRLAAFNVRALKDHYCLLATADVKLLLFQL